MKVLGLSLITNKVLMAAPSDKKAQQSEKHASHEEVLGAVEQSGKRLEAIVKAVVSKINLQTILSEVKVYLRKTLFIIHQWLSQQVPEAKAPPAYVSQSDKKSINSAFFMVPVVFAMIAYIRSNSSEL